MTCGPGPRARAPESSRAATGVVPAASGRQRSGGPIPRFGPGVGPESFAESLREGQELLDVHRLGPDLAVQAEALQHRIDLGLGPAVAPEAVEDAAQVLATVEEDLANRLVEPGEVADGGPLR